MLTALVLQLIQCVVILPDKLGRKKEKGNKKEKVCSDCNILFNITMRIKQNMLLIFNKLLIFEIKN